MPNITSSEFTSRLEAKQEAEFRARVLARCHVDCWTDGQIVRGEVDAVMCRECKQPRWDDGTRCRNCGAYQRYLTGEDND